MKIQNLKNSMPVLIVTALVGAVIALASNFVLTRDELASAEPGETQRQIGETQQADSRGTDYLLAAGPRRSSITVPAGTPLEIRLEEALSTKTTLAGERFTGRVVDPVVVAGRTVVPRGARVNGRVSESTRSQRIGGSSHLTLELTSLSVGGRQRPISAEVTVLGKKQTTRDAATIGGATAAGALLGRILGHDRGDEAKGTVVGAVVGGAVGTGVALSNRAQHVTLPEGATIELFLDYPVTV